jgi:hypothetical protein
MGTVYIVRYVFGGQWFYLEFLDRPAAVKKFEELTRKYDRVEQYARESDFERKSKE